MRIARRYLLREITAGILFITLALLGMFSFFDLIQELDSVGHGNYDMGKMLLFVLLSAPGHVYEVVPVAVLIGTMYALALLSRHSELVILRASGVSIRAFGAMLLQVGAIFALVTFLIGELVTPLSEKTAQRLRLKATESVVAQEFRSGLWVKDGQNFVNVEDVLPDAGLLNVHIYEFDTNFRLRTISHAAYGNFHGEHWDLKKVTQTQFLGDHIQTRTFPQADWRSVIRPELLNVLLVVPEKMAAWNLYFYIRHLAENHQDTTRYQIALWSKVVYPVACIVMMALALPFGFLQQRAGGVSAKIFTGIMIGITYQVLNRLFVHIGLLNDWSPLLSATLPTLLFLTAGVGMLYWVERGALAFSHQLHAATQHLSRRVRS